ncbi:MAG: hypothetical protein ACD_73C00714G0001, partial [uncultured bacterium]
MIHPFVEKKLKEKLRLMRQGEKKNNK